LASPPLRGTKRRRRVARAARSAFGPLLRNVLRAALAERIPHAMPVNKKPSSSSRFEGGNRPQRWGGAGTRDRMEFQSLGGGSQPSLGISSKTSLAQMDQRAPVYDTGGRTFESCTRCQQRVCIAKRYDTRSKAEGSRFDPVVRRQASRRSQVVEGIWLQTRRQKPASVQIGPSSPIISVRLGVAVAQWQSCGT
jgi:hypothetical protein